MHNFPEPPVMRLLKFQNENTGIVLRGATTFCFFKIEIFTIWYFWPKFQHFVNNSIAVSKHNSIAVSIIHKNVEISVKKYQIAKISILKK